MEKLGHAISIVKVNNSIYKILSNNKKIALNLENVKSPFGVDNYTYNKKRSYYLKLEIGDSLEKTILEMEEQVLNILQNINTTSFTIKSQIITNEKYNSNLFVKIKQYRDKIVTKIKNISNENVSLFDIEKNSILDLEISPNIYIDKDSQIILKWTAIKICVK